MKFKGEESLIDYIAYVNNLIIKAILKSLSFNTYKDAYTFLDRVKANS
jgi:pterin-4a-carbinolamine dehydratase